ncbi:hypothetical protein PG988_004707 [Apiospora saccharicola]
MSKDDNQNYQIAWVYSDEEIYEAFRDGAMLLWSAQNGHINLDDWQFLSYNGERFPRPLSPPAGWRRGQQRFIGMGTWNGQQSRANGTTVIYEWPLVPGGNWPQDPDSPVGFDRVLFQLVSNIPIYLGVVTFRGVFPDARIEQMVMSWGFIHNENGRVDTGAVETLRYPGIPDNTPRLPGSRTLTNRRSNMKRKGNGPWGSVYGGAPEPPGAPDPPPPGPGSGAGGSSGDYPRLLGPGGVSSGGGGMLGNEGALGGMGLFPQAGNVFAKSQPSLVPAPSHAEL